jgi:hypothetical protein
VRAIERWKAEMPTEAEMLPRDKYTIFDRHAKKYRKSIHSTFFLLSFSFPLGFSSGYNSLPHFSLPAP